MAPVTGEHDASRHGTARAADPDKGVRIGVARHIAAPVDPLSQLTSDPTEVRSTVADIAATRVDVLRRLATGQAATNTSAGA